MTRTRRSFLRGLAASLVVLLLPRVGAARSRRNAQNWIEVAANAPSARRVGRRWLELHPRDASIETLVTRLDLDTAPDREGLRRWRARQRADFRAGRVATLAGWTLSESEAQMCALAALLRDA